MFCFVAHGVISSINHITLVLFFREFFCGWGGRKENQYEKNGRLEKDLKSMR